jgi:hypothetical protein
MRHLLSTKTDPFSRMPLSEDQLVDGKISNWVNLDPNCSESELRQRIQDWKVEQKQKSK